MFWPQSYYIPGPMHYGTVVMGDVILSGTTIYFLLVSEQYFYSISSSNYPVVDTFETGASANGGDTEPTYDDHLPGMKLHHTEFHS
jgi:hypothetical protein